jgi:hypothetical protein
MPYVARAARVFELIGRDMKAAGATTIIPTESGKRFMLLGAWLSFATKGTSTTDPIGYIVTTSGYELTTSKTFLSGTNVDDIDPMALRPTGASDPAKIITLTSEAIRFNLSTALAGVGGATANIYLLGIIF